MAVRLGDPQDESFSERFFKSRTSDRLKSPGDSTIPRGGGKKNDPFSAGGSFWQGRDLGESIRTSPFAARNPQQAARGGGGAGGGFTNFDPQDLFYKQREDLGEQGGEEEGYSPLSIAEALARAMGLIGGEDGSYERVNYDPQRQALRSRAADSDARLEAMYRQLQGSYAADAPVLNAAYDTAVSSTNQTTDQGVGNVNAAYDKARADQSAQLAALGIEDAAAVIAGAGQSSTADQADAVANLEQNRGANVNQLQQGKRASGTFNTQIGQAAGLEGNLQRAANQSKLQQLLADIDAQESGANAQLANQAKGANQGMAFQLAQALIEEDRYGREYTDKRSDVDFDKQIQAQELAAKLQGDTAQRFDPQQAVTATQDYFAAQGIEPDAETYRKFLDSMRQLYSVGY